MKKNRMLLFWLVVVFVLVFSVGCGVEREKYDMAVVEVDSLNHELQSVRAELEVAKSEVLDLSTNLNEIQLELEATQGEMIEKKAVALEMEASLEKTITNNRVLEKELEDLQSEYIAANDELLKIKLNYPPRHFYNYQELNDWVSSHFKTGWNNTYNIHLSLQEEALSDGYIWFIAYNPDYKRLGYYGTGVGCGPHSGSLIKDIIMAYKNLHASAIAGNDIYSIYINGDIIWAGLVNPKLGRLTDKTMPRPEYPPQNPYQ